MALLFGRGLAWEPQSAAQETPKKTSQLEFKALCLEEQLHKMADGIHPDVGDLMSELATRKAETEKVLQELRATKEVVSQKDSMIASLRSALAERDARLMALEEEDVGMRDRLLQATNALKDALVDKSNQLAEARRGLEQAAHRADADRKQADAAAKEHASQRRAWETERLALRRAADDAERAALAAEATAAEHKRARQKAREELEQRTATLKQRDLELSHLRRTRPRAPAEPAAPLRPKPAPAPAQQPGDPPGAVPASLVEERVEAAERRCRAEMARQLDASDERWLAVVEAVRCEIRRCEAEVVLVASREARKTVLLAEYHAALSVIEEEKNELQRLLDERTSATASIDSNAMHDLHEEQAYDEA
ncbi:hypothetical protein DIPPA_28115 [Diplonema papillatum]|nr:hypothetical protein DIPPA_28115 [Diplonema papillatum]